MQSIESITWVRGRVLASLLLVVLFYSAGNYFLLKLVFTPHYRSMERKMAETEVQRLEDALSDELDLLAALAGKWATRAATLPPSPSPVVATSAPALFLKQLAAAHPLDVAYWCQPDGTIIWGEASAKPMAEVRKREPLLVAAWENRPFQQESSEFGAAKGFLLTAQGPMLVAAHKIHHRDRQAGAEDMLILGRLLNESLVSAVKKRLHLDFRLVNLQERNMPLEVAPLLSADEDGPRYAYRETEKTLFIYTLVTDPTGRAEGLVELVLPRHLARQNSAILQYTVVSSSAAGIFLIILFFTLYRREVIRAKTLTQRLFTQPYGPIAQVLQHCTSDNEKARVLEQELKNMILQTKQVQQYQEEVIRQRTAVLKETNAKLVTEIKERLRIEKDLHDIRGKLEEEVEKRTSELVRANQQLTQEVEERKHNEQELKNYQEQLRFLSSSLVNIEERERRQLASDLHDQIGQSLSVAKMYLDSLSETGGVADAEWRGRLRQIQTLLEQTIKDTRTLTFELSPPVLYELGLEAALEWLGERLQQQHNIQVQLECAPIGTKMAASFLALIFRTIRELLMNVIRHARASWAMVRIYYEAEMLCVDVIDNGQGLRPAGIKESEAGGMGFGLFSVRERLINLGGRVDIFSTPGSGTRVVLKIPLARCAAE